MRRKPFLLGDVWIGVVFFVVVAFMLRNSIVFAEAAKYYDGPLPPEVEKEQARIKEQEHQETLTVDPICNEEAKTCGFYKCVEKDMNCGSKGYFLNKGIKFCRAFEEAKNNHPKNKQFAAFQKRVQRCISREIQEVYDYDKMHLQHKMTTEEKCKRMDTEAFEAHMRCLDVANVCELSFHSWTVLYEVFRAVNLGLEGIQQMIAASENCQVSLSHKLFKFYVAEHPEEHVRVAQNHAELSSFATSRTKASLLNAAKPSPVHDAHFNPNHKKKDIELDKKGIIATYILPTYVASLLDPDHTTPALHELFPEQYLDVKKAEGKTAKELDQRGAPSTKTHDVAEHEKLEKVLKKNSAVRNWKECLDLNCFDLHHRWMG